MSNRIGFLVPRSAMYPSINFDMLNGLKAGAKHAGIEGLELKIESVGVGGDDKIIQAVCEQLLFNDVKIVVGYINPGTAEKLQPLFANAGALLITLDAGYHFPLSTALLPNVINVSLDGALCCRVVSKMCVDNGHKKVAYTTSFYDSGYRSTLAFANSLTEGGGNITFNPITKLKRDEFTLDPLKEHLKTQEADAVIASFCGDMFFDFCKTAAGDSEFANQTIYGSPFMADEHWLKQSQYPGTDINTAVTWASSLEHAANKAFIDTLTANNANINLFSLLAWEGAIVAAQFLKETNPVAAIAQFEGYNGPRGNMVFNKEINKVESPVYTAKVVKNEQSGNSVAKITGIYDAAAERALLKNDINEFAGKGTSWYNVYGCIDS